MPANEQTSKTITIDVSGMKTDEPGLPQQIVDMAREIQDGKRRIKAAREQRQEHLETFNEYEDLQEAKLATKGAEDKLKMALSQDDEWNRMSDTIQDQAHKLSDQEDILSQYLIAYRDEEDAEAVEFGDTERPIVLHAKLGKERPIQLDIFAENPEN